LLDKLKKMRISGLIKGGEFSVENLTYKALRKVGVIDEIFDMKYDSYDEKMSVGIGKERYDTNPVKQGQITGTNLWERVMIFNEKIFRFFIFSTMLFNVIDIAVTVRVIKYGNLDENNPFMKLFLNMDSIMPFIFIKTLLICGGLYLIYRKRDKIMAQIGAYLCFCFYWALIVQFYYFLWCK